MKTITTNYQNFMFIFDILQKFPVKKRADVAHVSALSKKLQVTMESEDTLAKEREIKDKYMIAQKDEKGDPIMEDGVEVKFPDPNKTGDMLGEIFKIEVSLDMNTNEIAVLTKALDNALKVGIVEGPIGAKIFAEVEALLVE